MLATNKTPIRLGSSRIVTEENAKMWIYNFDSIGFDVSLGCLQQQNTLYSLVCVGLYTVFIARGKHKFSPGTPNKADTMDFSKLKVADLKKELKNRGLSTVGNKNELQERLQLAALESSVLDPNVSDLLDEDVLIVSS